MNIPVIHVSTTIERGGAEKQLLILAREQISLGLQVTIVGLKGKPELEEEFAQLGAQVSKMIANHSFVSAMIKLRRIFRQNPNSIIHAHLPRAELLSRLALLGLSNTLIISRHNAESFFPKAPNSLSRLISLWVTQRAKAVIAISSTVSEYLAKSREISSQANLYIVTYGYDSNVKVKLKTWKPRNQSDSLQLITIGRLTDQKNYPFMFRALQKLKILNVPFSLTILGDGFLRAQLKTFAEELGISDALTWLGKQDDIPRILSNHDALIMSSKYEGFGLVLLEAMQQSLPIIAPDRSVFPEVLGSDYPGLFPADSEQEMAKLIEKLSDLTFYSKLSQASSSRLSYFEPRKMAQHITQLYC